MRLAPAFRPWQWPGVTDIARTEQRPAPRISFVSLGCPKALVDSERIETLDWLEARLGGQRFLMGQRLTEADWRLFTTLIRFDAVYFGHFKCNLREIRDYPALSRYLRELYHLPGVAETVDFFHIKHHYYESHLLREPPAHQSDGHRAGRAGDDVVSGQGTTRKSVGA